GHPLGTRQRRGGRRPGPHERGRRRPGPHPRVIATLPYGPATLTATLPDRAAVLSNEEPPGLAPIDDLDGAVRAALAEPVGLPRLGELVRPRAAVLIAFDDGTVPSSGPIRGVAIRAAVAESDLTVYVVPCYSRGFSGGWKSVCVGLSTYRSIKIHHTPDGMSMSLHANRMHALLDEMGRHLEARTGRRVFKIDTVAAGPFATARVFAGSVEATRRAALTTLETLFPPRRGLAHRQFDVFVYGVPDWSPYAIWSTTNPILTLVSSGLGYLGGVIEALGRPGCTVIMATPAPDRWDTARHPAYREVWERVLPVTRDPYRIMHEH